MRKIIVSEFVTLDGVMQAPGGIDEDTEGGFQHGGWTIPYWHDDLGNHFGDVLAGAGAMLLGRKTWEIHGGAFEPMADDDPNSVGFNVLPKYVVSNTLETADAWRNSILISGQEGEIVEQVRAIKQQPGGDIFVDGSHQLVHTLARHGLIDDLYLLVYPISLGSGKRIFPDDVRLNLRLIDATPVPSGVVVTHYAVEGLG